MQKLAITTVAMLALGGAAFAQNPPANTTASSKMPAASSTAVDHAALEGNWRASKLMGMAVYNQANEKLGDVNELIVDQTGKVSAVVIGVGGFLGMGEHDVAVAMSQLTVTDNGRPVSATTAAPNTVGTGTSSRPSPSQTANAKDWVPERLVLNATKDQLKNMKQFKYSD